MKSHKGKEVFGFFFKYLASIRATLSFLRKEIDSHIRCSRANHVYRILRCGYENIVNENSIKSVLQ
mgnify:CR=1 FL=1